MTKYHALFGFVLVSAGVGCGGNPDVARPDKPLGSGGSAGSGGGGTAGSAAAGGSISIGGSAPGGASGEGGAGESRCSDCGLGQHCDDDDGNPTCVDNVCEELECSESEECTPASGGGVYCADISCESDEDCPISRFCKRDLCVDDVCEAGTRRCDDDGVVTCTDNGGAEEVGYECGGAGYYTSECSGSTPRDSGCSCEDDWDCPEYTDCEAGVCSGRGEEARCTVPAVPFEDVLPELEFRWGGASAAQPEATGRPFAASAQVVTTPIVINLDDDNQDGKVNELDFPEIVFMTDDVDATEGGVVRAIHGGGPDKGEDYFALCGSNHWSEGDDADAECEGGTARPGGVLAAGDLDNDGFPEIVVPLDTGGLQILDYRGRSVATLEQDLRDSGPWYYPAPAIANLDFAGLAEIVLGNRVITLAKDGSELVFDRVFEGTGSNGTEHLNEEESYYGPSVCLADLNPDYPGLEIVAGTTAYRLPDPMPDCDAPNDVSDYCEGRLSVLWDAAALDDGEIDYPNGFCAVADVWGASRTTPPGPENPLDQTPEVVLVSDGDLLILDGGSGALILQRALGGGDIGGAPNVDDFDGDGFPEIATALANFYTVIDLQQPSAACPAWNAVMARTAAPPGANDPRTPGGECQDDGDCDDGTVCNRSIGSCVCLHNGWKRTTEDDSSRATSSSVFDFNGDGAAEVVYTDECYFRVYDGTSGGVYLALPSLNRTITENPVVADVDNDGNAEIVFAQNNAEGTVRCSESDLDSWPDGENDVPAESLPNGLEVWGDPTDVWVAARRVWNQHSYHVTNVTEAGAIPIHEPESWKPLNGRLYNTFRSQPRGAGVAPDLALTAIQISSPDVSCGELSDTLEISVEVRNLGDLRVGPGVSIEFLGAWADPELEEALEDAQGDRLSYELEVSLEPGAGTVISVEYERGRNDREDLPATITASIDAEGRVRECEESNNDINRPVEGGARIADLRIEVESASGCSEPVVEVTLSNDGSAAAEDVLVRIYAGDPSQGGTLLGEETLEDPLEPGASESLTLELDPVSLDIAVWAVVDPRNVIDECNDGNNRDEGPRLACDTIPR
jgi:hypothetical protein